MPFRLFFIGFLLLSITSFAQKKKRASKNESQATSVGPYYPEENKYAPKAKKVKRKNRGISRNAQENALTQRKSVAKQKRKAEKILEGPDYSNPTYFGHKRLPKKHKAGETKFCKVCGIRH